MFCIRVTYPDTRSLLTANVYANLWNGEGILTLMELVHFPQRCAMCFSSCLLSCLDIVLGGHVFTRHDSSCYWMISYWCWVQIAAQHIAWYAWFHNSVVDSHDFHACGTSCGVFMCHSSKHASWCVAEDDARMIFDIKKNTWYRCSKMMRYLARVACLEPRPRMALQRF